MKCRVNIFSEIKLKTTFKRRKKKLILTEQQKLWAQNIVERRKKNIFKAIFNLNAIKF